MEVLRKDVWEKILACPLDHITLLSHFSYPIGTSGPSYIAQTNRDEVLAKKEGAEKIFEYVDTLLDRAVITLKLNGGKAKSDHSLENPMYDNKTAVKCRVPGIEQPVCFVTRDWRYIVCFEVDTDHGSTERVIVQPSTAWGGEGDE